MSSLFKGYDIMKDMDNKFTNSHATPNPTPNDKPFVKDLVLKDLADRVQFGFNKYKTYLQPHNGRDALIDLYQEQWDALFYIRQLLFEKYGE